MKTKKISLGDSAIEELKTLSKKAHHDLMNTTDKQKREELYHYMCVLDVKIIRMQHGMTDEEEVRFLEIITKEED